MIPRVLPQHRLVCVLSTLSLDAGQGSGFAIETSPRIETLTESMCRKASGHDAELQVTDIQHSVRQPLTVHSTSISCRCPERHIAEG